jgi:hypothetical protein
MQKLVGLEREVGNSSVGVKREQEVGRRIEDPDLRVRVKGLAPQDVGIPERKLESLHPRERVALPNVVLVEEVPAEDLPLLGVGMEELPVKKKRQDRDDEEREKLLQSTWVETRVVMMRRYFQTPVARPKRRKSPEAVSARRAAGDIIPRGFSRAPTALARPHRW